MNIKEIKGMILAAGLGTRMRPLTDAMPKSLLPVAGRALIDWTLDWFAKAGVGDVVVNSFYKADMLEAHLAARVGAPKIRTLREEVLLETGGGIKNALPYMGTPFFSANSDAICIDGKIPALHRLLQAWDDEAMDALLLVYPLAEAVGHNGKGDFFVDGGRVRRRGQADFAPFVYTGVQLLHPRIFKNSPEGAFSMNVLYDRDRTEDGTLHRVHTLVHDGKWLDVGDPEGLKLAEQRLSAANI